MLNELKSFTSVQRMETEEIVALSAFGRALEAEFTALSVDAPEWLGNQTKAVRREIRARNADAIANKIRAAKARRATLASVDEKRASVDAEIAELEKKAAEAGV